VIIQFNQMSIEVRIVRSNFNVNLFIGQLVSHKDI